MYKLNEENLTIEEVEAMLLHFQNPNLNDEVNSIQDEFKKPKQTDLNKYVEIEFLREEKLVSGYGENYDNFLSMLQIENPLKAYEMAKCHKTFLHFHDSNFNYQKKAHCKDRFCPFCAKVRSMKHNKALRKFFKKLRDYAPYLRFVTLTYENVPSLDDFDFKQISKDMIKFRRILGSFGYEMFGGYRVTEHKYSLETGHNIHIHMLYFADFKPCEKSLKNFRRWSKKYDVKNKRGSPATLKNSFTVRETGYGYIDYKVLNSVWQYANHKNSYVTDIKIIKYGVGAGINYICKYILKSSEIDNSELLFYVYKKVSNFRLIQKFGSLFMENRFSVIRLTKVFMVNIITYEKLKYGYKIDNPFMDEKYIEYLESGIT